MCADDPDADAKRVARAHVRTRPTQQVEFITRSLGCGPRENRMSDLRLGSKVDITRHHNHVCFTPQTVHAAAPS
jgi:hypothetical protein